MATFASLPPKKSFLIISIRPYRIGNWKFLKVWRPAAASAVKVLDSSLAV